MFESRNLLIAIALLACACHSGRAPAAPHVSSYAPKITPPPIHATGRADVSASHSLVQPLAEVVSTGHEPCANPYDEPIPEPIAGPVPARRHQIAQEVLPCPKRSPVGMPAPRGGVDDPYGGFARH